MAEDAFHFDAFQTNAFQVSNGAWNYIGIPIQWRPWPGHDKPEEPKKKRKRRKKRIIKTGEIEQLAELPPIPQFMLPPMPQMPVYAMLAQQRFNDAYIQHEQAQARLRQIIAADEQWLLSQ